MRIGQGLRCSLKPRRTPLLALLAVLLLAPAGMLDAQSRNMEILQGSLTQAFGTAPREIRRFR